MNNLILAVFVIAEILLGCWCWSYSTYKDSIDKALSLYEVKQDLAAVILLKEFKKSAAGTLYRQIPSLSRLHERVIHTEATAKMRLGEGEAASELFQQIVTSKHAEIQHASFYNLALLHFRKGDFISARAELSNSLRIMPDDQDSKYNLEILVRKEQERKKKKSDQKGSAPPPQKMMKKESQHFPEDLWRYEMPEEGEGSDSKIRRRYL